MNAPEPLTSLSREALLTLVAEQQQQLAAQQRQLAELTARVEALQAEVERLRRGAKRQAAPFSRAPGRPRQSGLDARPALAPSATVMLRPPRPSPSPLWR
jgi:hypothetical protein